MGADDSTLASLCKTPFVLSRKRTSYELIRTRTVTRLRVVVACSCSWRRSQLDRTCRKEEKDWSVLARFRNPGIQCPFWTQIMTCSSSLAQIMGLRAPISTQECTIWCHHAALHARTDHLIYLVLSYGLALGLLGTR